MATLAQIDANRANAQRSTGPRTSAGKAAVSANARRHGLAGTHFALLPEEDPAEFEALLNDLMAEHQPATPTEAFLVREMVQAEWKLRRIARLEIEILTGRKKTVAAKRFAPVCAFGSQLAGLTRYESAARNAWHRALNQLRQLRKDRRAATPAPAESRAEPACETKPIPAHLERELSAHKRRDPLFDPHLDRSQMSKALQKYFG